MEESDLFDDNNSNEDLGSLDASESTDFVAVRDVEAPRRFKNKRIPTEVRLSSFVAQAKPVKKRSLQPTGDKERKGSTPTTEAVSPSENSSSSLLIADPLDEKVLQFVKLLKSKQDDLWKTNENKARAHRRLVFGLRESLKHLVQSNVHCIFLARNIDAEMTAGSSASVYHKLRTECLAKRIPLISAATKKSLSKVVSKHPYISCVAVLRFPGREKMFDEIVDSWRTGDQYISYHLDQISLFP